MRKSLFPALFGLLVLASPVAVDANGRATPGRPAENPGEWIHAGDYPTAALLERIEGTTAFELTYDTGGNATGCKVTQGSGSAVLDETTCALLTKRARFAPGRDSQGKLVGGSYSSRVRWILPKLPLPLGVQTLKVEFDVSDTGEIEQCRVVEGAAIAEEMRTGGHHPCGASDIGRRNVYVGDDGVPRGYREIRTMSLEFQRR
jgi:TonB family protein